MDPDNRAGYWRTKRNQLLELKKEERAKQMERFGQEDKSCLRPKSSQVAKRIMEDPGSATDGREEKRQVLLQAIAQRFKKETSQK